MRVRILGAGVIGLACADELLRRGHLVEVIDPAPGQGASFAAGGMLSPSAELWHGEEVLFDLGQRSLDLWPAYAEGLGVPLHRTGTLVVGHDHGDLQQVERQATLTGGRLLTGHEVRALEPTAARVAGGLFLPDEASVDPRAVVAALLERVPITSTSARADVTVIATGAVLPDPFTPLVRRVGGEIARARMADPPTRTIRGWVRGEAVYVVPRPNGEVVIGATSDEHDEPAVPTVGGITRLLATARALLPALERAELLEAIARDRPGTADNLPLIGPSGEPGVVLAAGHFRHGVLLAPLTAQLIADHLETGHVEPAVDPRRFFGERGTAA